MTSLAIAPCSQGCNTHASYMLQSGMPFSDASCGRGKSSLETGLQAVSLSPYCTGLAAQQSQRQDCPPLHGYAIVPSAFRLQVSPSTSGIFLEMPPDYIGNTSVRHMAHMRFCMRYTCCSSLRQGSLFQLSLAGSSGDSRLPFGAFVCAIRLAPLPSISSCLRQPIQQLSCWRLLLRQSCSQVHWLEPTCPIDQEQELS